jgi:tetratricopeptide (TPR) repeat protein
VAPKEEYSRAQVRRKFRLTERQLQSWEKQELIASAEKYSFTDLIAFQTLVKLRQSRIGTREIASALRSLREKLSVKKPLVELKIVNDGRRIRVYVGGQKMEALSGQILLDFDAEELGALRAFPDRKRSVNRTRESEEWFQRGLELEETGAPVERAVEAYQKVLELNPSAAGALVNLGTIYYRQRRFDEAEKYYVRAIEADPLYPLAQFNLGNLFDEQGRWKEAHDHYKRALALNPQYGDAHFNLALLCERLNDPLRAVHHWKVYLKIDPSGQWAEIARRQLERLREAVLR